MVLLAALLLAASASLQAAERQRPNDSSDHGRTAVPRDSGGSNSRPSSPPPSSPPSSPPSTSSDDSPGRRAVPRDGGNSGDDSGPHRQRPHVDRDGRGGGGGGGGYYYPGYYYPRNYGSRYYGPFWGWGSFWSWYFYDDWFYYPHDYGWPPYGRGGSYYSSRGSMGALDLDVSPGRAEVYIDGRYQGIVDQYDGFPQYLWLPRGTYDVVLFREGYRTVARQISIYPGSVISVDDRLERGESVRPEDLASKTHDRRDERIRSEEERREEIARRGDDRDDDAGDWRDWRDRGRYRSGGRGERGEREGSERTEEEMRDRGERSDESGARVRLDVEPSDASVYLDGRFVGTGLDLERGTSLRLDPGEHRIAVVRPGHKAEEKEFTIAAGEELELEIELDSLE